MMAEDLDIFFDTDDFAVTATILGSSVSGILREEFIQVDFVESKRPVFECIAADVTGIVHGDTVVISSTTYKVRGIQPDGTGIVKLVLELQ